MNVNGINIIPTTISEWIEYFYSLKSEYGIENAKNIWLMTWQEIGTQQFLQDVTFKSFLAKNKINVYAGAVSGMSFGTKLLITGGIISGVWFFFVLLPSLNMVRRFGDKITPQNAIDFTVALKGGAITSGIKDFFKKK